MKHLGMESQTQTSDELFGLPVRIAALAPRPDRLPMLVPVSDTELETNRWAGEQSLKTSRPFTARKGITPPL